MPPMRVAALIAVSLLGLWPGRAPASASACPELETEAADVTALRDADPAAGLARGETALASAQTRQPRCPAGEAMLLSAIGSNLHILGRNREAVDRYEQALALLPEDATPAQQAIVHRGAGVALADIEAYETALEHYLTALAASRSAGDTLEAAKTAGNIGNLYSTLGQLDRSREYHEQALRDFEAADFKPGIAGTLINLGALAAKFADGAKEAGDASRERRENRRLRDYNRRALDLFTELGNERGIAYAASNIGLALERLGEPEQALAQHERALALRQRIGDVHGEINSNVTMASTLIRLGRYGEAQSQLDQAQARLPAGNLGLSSIIAERRVELAEARGDFREALRWQREITRLHTALATEDHSARVAELERRFDNEQQAREIELLRTNAEVRELQLGRQRLLLHVGLAVAVLLILLFVVLVSRMRLGRRITRELERAARTDAVTGLANRRHMIERIEYEIQRARRSDRPFVLLMADIDRFKTINDRYGHGVGDAVLIEIAQRLGRRLRTQDTLARWGGEEFLILLPDTDLAGGRVLAEQLRAAVGTEPMTVDADPLILSVSLGVAEYAPGMSVDECVNDADKAMYAGKRAGGDRVVAYRREAPSVGTP